MHPLISLCCMMQHLSSLMFGYMPTLRLSCLGSLKASSAQPRCKYLMVSPKGLRKPFSSPRCDPLSCKTSYECLAWCRRAPRARRLRP